MERYQNTIVHAKKKHMESQNCKVKGSQQALLLWNFGSLIFLKSFIL